MKVKKNRAAVTLGRRRWLGIPSEERSRLAKHAVEARERKRAQEKSHHDSVAAQMEGLREITVVAAPAR